MGTSFSTSLSTSLSTSFSTSFSTHQKPGGSFSFGINDHNSSLNHSFPTEPRMRHCLHESGRGEGIISSRRDIKASPVQAEHVISHAKQESQSYSKLNSSLVLNNSASEVLLRPNLSKEDDPSHLKANPDAPKTGIKLVCDLIERVQLNKAISEFQELTKPECKNKEAFLGFAKFLSNHNHIEKAILILKEFIDANPNQCKMYAECAYDHSDSKRNVSNKILLLKEHLKINQKDVNVYLELADLLGEQCKIEEAISTLKKLRELCPNMDDVFFKCAIKLLGDTTCYTESILLIKEHLKINPKDMNPFSTLVEIGRLDNAQMINEVILLFREYLKVNPQNIKVLFKFGKFLSIHNRTDEAIEIFQDLLKREPKEKKAYFELGSLLCKTAQIDEAILKFIKHIELNSNDQDSYLNCAYTLKTDVSVGKAFLMLEKLQKLYPDDEKLHITRGILQWEKKHAEEAIESFKTAINLNNDSRAYVRLEEIYIFQNELEMAIKMFQKAVRIPSTRVLALCILRDRLFEQDMIDDMADKYENELDSQTQKSKFYIEWGIRIAKREKLHQAKEKLDQAKEKLDQEKKKFFKSKKKLHQEEEKLDQEKEKLYKSKEKFEKAKSIDSEATIIEIADRLPKEGLSKIATKYLLDKLGIILRSDVKSVYGLSDDDKDYKQFMEFMESGEDLKFKEGTAEKSFESEIECNSGKDDPYSFFYNKENQLEDQARILSSAFKPCEPEGALIMYYKLGETCFDQGNFQKAAQAFKNVLIDQPTFPKNINALNFLGEIQIRENNLDEAIGIFTKIKDERKAQILLANALCRQGKVTDAQEKLEKLRASNVNDGDGHARGLYGVILILQGKFDEAVKNWQEVYDLGLEFDAFEICADLLFQGGKYNYFAKEFKQANSNEFKYVKIATLVDIALVLLGQLDTLVAVRYFEDSDPIGDWAIQNLGRLLDKSSLRDGILKFQKMVGLSSKLNDKSSIFSLPQRSKKRKQPKNDIGIELDHELKIFNKKLNSELAKKDMSEQDKVELKEYFKAFGETFISICNMSHIVENGQSQLPFKDVKPIILSTIASFAPIIKPMLSPGQTSVSEFIGSIKLKNCLEKIKLLKGNTTGLSQLVRCAAYEKLLNNTKLQQIVMLTNESMKKESGELLFNRESKSCNNVSEGINRELYNSLYKSPASKLGHNDANELIKQWFDVILDSYDAKIKFIAKTSALTRDTLILCCI